MNNGTPSPRTALVVEDDQLMLNVLHEALEDADFATTTVDRGSLAMAMLAERRFDVLLVDINLPDMNGLSICEAARTRYQEQIAILVMSGQDNERWRLASLQICADDFLGKPFDLEEFAARIESKVRRVPTN